MSPSRPLLPAGWAGRGGTVAPDGFVSIDRYPDACTLPAPMARTNPEITPEEIRKRIEGSFPADMGVEPLELTDERRPIGDGRDSPAHVTSDVPADGHRPDDAGDDLRRVGLPQLRRGDAMSPRLDARPG